MGWLDDWNFRDYRALITPLAEAWYERNALVDYYALPGPAPFHRWLDQSDDFMYWADLRLDGMFSKFLNHTAYVSGETTRIPAWTEADIYAHLGEDRIRYRGGRIQPRLFKNWAFQFCRVLNLLRWRRESHFHYPTWISGPGTGGTLGEVYDSCLASQVRETTTSTHLFYYGMSYTVIGAVFGASNGGYLQRHEIECSWDGETQPQTGAFELIGEVLNEESDVRDWVNVWPGGSSIGQVLNYTPTLAWNGTKWYHQLVLRNITRSEAVAYGLALGSGRGVSFALKLDDWIVRHELTGEFRLFQQEDPS